CHFDRREKSCTKDSLKSRHSGLIFRTRLFFFSRRHFFISFSLANAAITSLVSSKYTSLLTWYFSVNPFNNLFLCSYVRRSKSFVTPTYITLLFRLVSR